MYKKERKSWMKHLDFTILDIICLELAYALSYFMRFGRKNEFLNEEYQRLAVVLILIDICVVFFGESYKSILRRKNTQEFKHVVVHATIIVAGMMVYGYWTRQSDFSRQIFLMFWGLSMIFEFVGRSGLKNFIKKKMMNDRNLSAMIVVTTDELVESCLKEFENLPYREFAVHGVVVVDAMRKGEIIRGIPVVANADDFFEYVKNNVVDEVFINGNTIASSQALADDLLEMGVTVHFNLVHASKLMPNKVIEQCGNYMVLTSSMCIATPRQLFFKRLMDIVGGFVGLVIAGIATIIFAPIIKKQSPGPIFFSQIRVGKNGRKFRFYKFRSMNVNAEEQKKELMEQNEMSGLMFKMEDDPRVFPVGRFMRKFSIDELPSCKHTLVFVHIEPSLIQGVIDPAGTQISLSAKCPPSAVDFFPMKCTGIAHRPGAVTVAEPPASGILYPMAVTIIHCLIRCTGDNPLLLAAVAFLAIFGYCAGTSAAAFSTAAFSAAAFSAT